MPRIVTGLSSVLTLPVLALGAAVALLAGPAFVEAQPGPEIHPDLPPTFHQLLPRGRIAAVDEPQFVSADEAKISGDAWVLGVVYDGQAKAYSLNLLNHHEVVNDVVGGRPMAAVW